ncbi:MAG: TonB-dependent receptor [Opitutaceae bacterium]|nr:TonB-dependent receptor [Opitutaceae bacterium]
MNIPYPQCCHFLRLLGMFGCCYLVLPPSIFAQAAASPDEEVIRLSEFTVSAEKDVGYATTNAIGVTRTNTALIDTPQAVAVINQEFLRDAMASELYDVLKYISGVAIESNVGDSVMIRGYVVRSQYTDGFADNQNQSQAGAEPFLFERLEVLKGPSAIVYGSHATGGVLNRVRKSPQWKPAGELALTYGNHSQKKAEVDYTAPLNKHFAYRIIGVVRDEDLNNGVNTRFSWFRRWNVDPMIAWRPWKNVQVKLTGEFLHEKGFKHWSDNAELQPFGRGAATTFGLLPRDFTFTDPWAYNENDKRAVFASIEAQPVPEWSLRLAGYMNFWDHDVYDIFAAGMQINNRLMNRTSRFATNYDSDKTVALESIYNFNIGPTNHKLLFIGQHFELNNEASVVTHNAPPALDIYTPTYNYLTPVNPRLTSKTNSRGENQSLSFHDHIRLAGDKLQFVAGARFDKYRSHADSLLTGFKGARNSGDNWTYKGGVVWKPRQDFSLFYNYSETFTANFGANPDGSTFKPSTGVVNEIGLKTALHEGRITATVSIFDLRLKQIIGLHPDPDMASAGYRVQLAQQITKGAEADLILNMLPGWDLMLSGAKMDISLPTKLLPRNAPEYTGALWTRYKFQNGALKGFVVGLGANRKGKVPGEVGNEVMFPAVTTMDAFAQYSWRRYRVSLNVSNLSDKWYLARGINRNLFLTGPERLIKLRVACLF